MALFVQLYTELPTHLRTQGARVRVDLFLATQILGLWVLLTEWFHWIHKFRDVCFFGEGESCASTMPCFTLI